MRSPLTVLHVTAPAEAGGLESVVHLLATGQRGRGTRATVAGVVPPGGEDHPFLANLREADVPVVALEIPPRAYRQESAAIAALCRELVPDVVHTHGYRCDVLASRVARKAGIPVLSTVHGFTGGGWKNRLYERLQLRSLRRLDAVVAVSRPLGEDLLGRGIPSHRLHVVPNAWDGPAALDRCAARRALEVPDDAFRVGWVGRLSREKGADVFLDAMALLADLPLSASVVGSGVEGPGLRRRAARLGLGHRITWHGVLPDAHRIYPAFDLFVLSSRTEGTPMVLFEAMAAGVPLVATRVGGVPDVVSDEEARLVPPEDPRALADGIRSVWRERDDALARASAARERLRRDFGPGPWLDSYDRLYRLVREG